MLFSNKFKNFYFLLVILILFIFFYNLNIASAATSADNIMVWHKGAAYPGQEIYFSKYIFKIDELFYLKKGAFLSLNSSVPPFDYFYCKVILPNNEIRWALVSFVESGCNITNFSVNSSLAFDNIFKASFEPFINNSSNLDWKVVFSNNVYITFITNVDNIFKIYVETTTVCKV